MTIQVHIPAPSLTRRAITPVAPELHAAHIEGIAALVRLLILERDWIEDEVSVEEIMVYLAEARDRLTAMEAAIHGRWHPEEAPRPALAPQAEIDPAEDAYWTAEEARYAALEAQISTEELALQAMDEAYF